MSERARGRSQELSSKTSVTGDFELELEVPAGIWERFGSLAHRRMSDKPVALVVIAVDLDEANEETDHLLCMAAPDKRHDAAPFSDIVTQLWP